MEAGRKSEKSRRPWGLGCISAPLLTPGLWLAVVQVFCIIPKYIQPFLRETIVTRE